MIRMKIAFALRLVDDYSGKDIRKNSFLFSIGERIVHPVEKENGLYIFLEPQEAVTRVHPVSYTHLPLSWESARRRSLARSASCLLYTSGAEAFHHRRI